MEFVKDILKGSLVGVANIIPGVSGGTMAVSMGIYDKLITAVTHIFKDFKKSLRILLPIVIGAVLGIGILAFVIKWLFANYPVQTNLLFIGLIVGGLPVIWKKTKKQRITAGAIVTFLVFLSIVILFPIFGNGAGAEVAGILQRKGFVISGVETGITSSRTQTTITTSTRNTDVFYGMPFKCVIMDGGSSNQAVVHIGVDYRK